MSVQHTGLRYERSSSMGFFESIQKLEKYMIPNIPSEVLSEVADVTASAAMMGRPSRMVRQNPRPSYETK